MWNNTVRVASALLMIVLLACTSAIAEDSRQVPATGMANIEGNNTMAARDAAIRDAMRKAVETGLGTMIESQTVVENFALLNDRIYSRSQGFVSSYEVISEKEEHGSYVVAINAVVNMNQLGNDLRSIGMLQDMVGKPRMMIMIDEYWWDPGLPASQQRAVEDPSSAARIAENFINRGFSLVDRDMVAKLRSQEMMMMQDLMDNPDAMGDLARKAAEEYQAEVLIIGTCKVEPVSDTGGRYTANAVFDCKMVNTSTGAMIGAKQYNQSGASVSPEGARSQAAMRAGDGVSSTLIDQVLQHWQAKANNGQDFIVKLYGVESYVQQGMRFLKALKGIAGVTQAQKRTWDEPLQRMEVDVTYKGGDVDDLTMAIVEAVMDQPGFENIDLRESKGNNINLYLK